MTKFIVRLKVTAYGDYYLIRNGYKSATQGWNIGQWETIKGRRHVSFAKESSDKTVWECEIPTDVWNVITDKYRFLAV